MFDRKGKESKIKSAIISLLSANGMYTFPLSGQRPKDSSSRAPVETVIGGVLREAEKKEEEI